MHTVRTKLKRSRIRRNQSQLRFELNHRAHPHIPYSLYINIWNPSKNERIHELLVLRFRSLLIHVNNAISSAKSFAEDNLSTSIPPIVPKRTRGEAKRREREGERGNKTQEEVRRNWHEFAIQLPSSTESPSKRFNSRRWATSRRGANETRPDSSADLFHFVDRGSARYNRIFWRMRGHLSFLTDGPTDGAKQREREKKKEKERNNNKKNKKGREKEKKDRGYCWLQRIHLRIAAYENNATWSLVTSAARPRFIFQGITLSISSSFPSPPISSFFSPPPLSIIPPVLHAGIWIALHATRVVLYYHS